MLGWSSSDFFLYVTCFQDEIVSPEEKEIRGAYEELYVLISADTYEKVDAAVALIELLVTPVSVSFII